MIDLTTFGLIPVPKCERESGEQVGRWTLLAFGRKPGAWQTFAVAQCGCGSEPKAVRLGNITQGLTTNCGCVRRAGLTKHGVATRKGDTRSGIYRVWVAMVDRCTNPDHDAYSRYGGRGIAVCDRWQDVRNFVADMGGTYRRGLTIERQDNDLGYSKENCYWATRSEQTRNRRTTLILTIDGITKPLAQWADENGLDYSVVYTRIKNGCPAEIAVTRQSRRGKRLPRYY